jgi:CysZ protein
MQRITDSLMFALRNFLHPRMLWLMAWPVVVALVVWIGVLVLMWAEAIAWLGDKMRAWITHATFFIDWDPTLVAMWLAKALLIVMLLPLVQVTALLILGVFGMPSMVEHVVARNFQTLDRRHGGTFAGSVVNSIVAVLGLIGLGLLSLPFWFFPPIWPAIPVVIFGWVNQRVLRYDALAEHATEEEMPRVFREQRWGMYLLGAILALVAYIPFVGLFAPVVFGLAFIHYLLEALQRSRAAPAERAALAR